MISQQFSMYYLAINDMDNYKKEVKSSIEIQSQLLQHQRNVLNKIYYVMTNVINKNYIKNEIIFDTWKIVKTK